MNRDEIAARLGEIRGRQEELDKEFAGQAFPDAEKDEFERLEDEKRELATLDAQLEERERIIKENGDKPELRDEPQFQTRRPGVTRGDDIWDLSTVRASVSDPQEATREMHDRAKRAIEHGSYPTHDDTERVERHLEKLLERDDESGTIARRMLTTGSPTYRRAFAKYCANMPLTSEEQRAASLTAASGGYAVPFTLDPTVLPTSNLSVNPYRQIARVEQITTDDWKGVSSAGVTAAFAAEATEASDNAPTLAQPTVSTEKAQCFIPYSIEVGMDWSSLEAEMGALIQDAKDDLESTKFTTGSGTNEPFGVLTGATTVYTTSGSASFALADLYGLEQSLGPRFRARASVVGNRAQFNKIRAFDTAGGAGIWVPNLTIGPFANAGATQGQINANVLGYPSYEASAMASVLTSGSLILVIGDFRYFLIADRIGLTVENIPHLFGATSRFPTGQRGLYAYWRTGSKVLDANAFRVAKTQ